MRPIKHIVSGTMIVLGAATLGHYWGNFAFVVMGGLLLLVGIDLRIAVLKEQPNA